MRLFAQERSKLVIGALSAVYVAVFVFMLIARPGTKDFYHAFFNLYQAIPPAFAGVCGVLVAARCTTLSKARRWGWLLIGLGCLSFCTGQSIWFYWESVRGVEVPFPGPSDYGYVGAPPLLLAGVLLLINSFRGVGRARHFLDSALATASIGMLSWQFIIAKQWAQTDLTLLGRIITVAYPLGDIAVIFAAIVAVTATSQNRVLKKAMKLVAAGMVMIAFSDTVFTLLTMAEKYETGSWADWGWSFGWLTIGWACLAIYYSVKSRSSEEPSLARERFSAATEFIKVYGPYLSVFASIAIILGHEWATTGHIRVTNHVEVLALLSLVVVRQLFMVLENAKLAHTVRVMNDNLETLVSSRTHQLESLQGLTKAVSSILDLDSVIGAAMESAKDVMDSKAVAIWLKPETLQSEDILILAGQLGFEDHSDSLGFLKQMDPGCHVFSLASTNPEAGENGHFVVADLVWQGEVLGRIAVANWNRVFEDSDARLLESIGVVVGTAVQNAMQHESAVQAADHDSVTGLYNHRAFHAKFDRQLRAATQRGQNLSLLFLDLDNFKLFNDTYGHVAGDDVLKTVAGILNHSVPDGSVVSRFGGDEFVVAIPDAPQSIAGEIAEAISSCMATQGYKQNKEDDRRIPIGASIGVAVYPLDGRNRHELLTVADKNLYEAKNNGNRIVMTTEEQRENRALRAYESFETLDALVTAVDNKDRYTRKHSEEVTEYSLWIADEVGISEESMRSLRISGLLHDVGKIGVPDEILRKPGRLTPEEYEIMQRHPRLGELIVGAIPGMEGIVDGVRSHHERWDGQGYPDQLAGMNIPLFGRILAVADAFSAMTTDRPYRKGMDWDEALEIVHSGAGTQFDPEMAQAFLKAVKKRRKDAAIEKRAA